MKFQKYLDFEALTKLRRDLHQHPELGFEEIRTSRIVADYLLELGLWSPPQKVVHLLVWEINPIRNMKGGLKWLRKDTNPKKS